MSVILNRREAATVIAGLRLLAGDGVRVPNHPHVLVAGLCDETEPEYDLRFDADEEYVRELIDRIDVLDAGIADQHVQAAELADRAGDALVDLRLLRDVDRER